MWTNAKESHMRNHHGVSLPFEVRVRCLSDDVLDSDEQTAVHALTYGQML